MWWSTCVRVKAPLIPEVALVELPPMKSSDTVSRGSEEGFGSAARQEKDGRGGRHTVLVEKQHIATRQVDGVSSAQAGNWSRVSCCV